MQPDDRHPDSTQTRAGVHPLPPALPLTPSQRRRLRHERQRQINRYLFAEAARDDALDRMAAAWAEIETIDAWLGEVRR